MSNEIKTRRLIVTLPDTSGEEADTACSAIEDFLLDYVYGDKSSHGLNVTHALGESLQDDLTARSAAGDVILDQGPDTIIVYGALGARQLAGVLLAHAEDLELAEAKRRHPAGRDFGHAFQVIHVTDTDKLGVTNSKEA